MTLRQRLTTNPYLTALIRFFIFKVMKPKFTFTDSNDYWQQRYQTGGSSGVGSFSLLAEFKAQVINDFVRRQRIESVIEFGCGDGSQLTLGNYPHYLGVDISDKALSLCRQRHGQDQSKDFILMEQYQGQTAQLALSLDVIYHLLEDQVFEQYMTQLFSSAERYVVIYSSNTDVQETFQAPHVHHRRFSDWIEQNTDWLLLSHIKNAYPYKGDPQTGSFADFYIYVNSDKSSDAVMPDNS